MKNAASMQNTTVMPSLFQIAAHFEDYVSSAGLKNSAPALSETPFADLMLHPEKLEAVLKPAKAGSDVPDAPRIDAPKKRNHGGSAGKPSGHSLGELKKTEFFLDAPAAKSVKLAADFTSWEKSSLDMMRSEDGVWFSVIPLAPGQYSYRFIVDGEWCDDPCSTQRVPNPFGTENSLIVIT